jgi:hypothetical protein
MTFPVFSSASWTLDCRNATPCAWQMDGNGNNISRVDVYGVKTPNLSDPTKEGRMMKRSLVVLMLVTLLLTACATAYATQAPGMNRASQEQPLAPAAPAPQSDGYTQSSEGGVPSVTQDKAAAEERIVLMNADLSIVVVDPGSAMNTITTMANDMGGFVVSSRLYKVSTNNGVIVPEATITVRVPAEKLTTAMDQIKSLVKDSKNDILSENVSGQDVTKEYTDLKSQLTNLQQAEKQLQNIMDSATKTEDVLAVYNQLVQVRQQIDVLQGQIQYYDQAARLSAISVTIQAEASVAPLTIGGWQPVGTARNAVQALVNSLKFLANAAIWIILFIIPILAAIALPIWLLVIIIRAILRRNKKRKVGVTATPEK